MVDTGRSQTQPASPARFSLWARWGLLLVALAMAAALVTSAAVGYRQAGRSARELSVVSGMSLVRSVMRDLAQAEGEPKQSMEWIVESLREEGLTFAGLYDSTGHSIATAGRPTAVPLQLPPPPRAPLPFPVGEGRLRLVSPPFRPGRHGPHHGPGMPMFGSMADPVWHHAFLVVEYRPLRSIALRRRAARTLALNLAAALVLAGAAAFFWRLSLRADRVLVQLAQDRRLRDLGQMSAILGHEIRNPLASLKGNAQLLLERTDQTDPARPLVEVIVNEARRLETLTHQVLDFARSARLDLAPTELEPMLREAIDRARAEPVELSLASDLPSWPLDRTRIGQLLENLLSNARAASPDQGVVRIDVRLEDQTLVIEVSDQGPGLEADEIERVFEPFYTRRVQGTGLGLALARRIAIEHGGSLTASNHPQGGAIFTLRLPRAEG